MISLILFTFASGLATILAPCIWPILPILLVASEGKKRKPLGLSLGIVVSFAFLTLLLSSILSIFSVNFDPDIIRYIGFVFLLIIGISLLIPAVSTQIEVFSSKILGMFSQNQSLKNDQTGFWGGFATGIALGTLWSPCAGPILAAIATLIGTRQFSIDLFVLVASYSIGVFIPLLAFSLLGQKFITRARGLNKYTAQIQKGFGIVIILVAFAIFTNFDKTIQAKLLDAFPFYTNLITKLELSDAVSSRLDRLFNGGRQSIGDAGSLDNFGKAPEIMGISNWINSEPLTVGALKGKVVLIDFWTYTCINCVRTLPYLNDWHEKYADDGLVIIGVHSPEFEFEKKTENVEKAVADFELKYPIAQDNEFITWKNYKNRFWPAHYLIDAEGNLRYYHFGEGNYDETEKTIQILLKDAGTTVNEKLTKLETENFEIERSPETYLGLDRMQRYVGEVLPKEGKVDFGPSLGTEIPQDYFTFNEDWVLASEYAETTRGSILEMKFKAKKVFLVITPIREGNTAKIFLDNKPISSEDAGADVTEGVLNMDKERLYELVNTDENKTRNLKIEFDNTGVKVFAFTFGG